MAEEIAGEIVLANLAAIKKNPDNPNSHTADQVRLLAQNIKRYGLRNAIELKKVGEGDESHYEILTGEGRFLAYCHLRDTQATEEWTRIPAVIRENEADGEATSGKRLSENALRFFNWAAECIEFASLKAAGESLENLMNDFGYGKSTIYNMVAVGQTLAHLNLTKEAIFQLTGKLAREDFIKYILPLRISPRPIQSRKGHKGFKEALDGSYDYSEVKACVQALLSNKLTVEDLPEYSEEHRPSAKKNGSVKAKTEQQAPNSSEVLQIAPIIQIAPDKVAEQDAVEASDTVRAHLPSESHPFIGVPGSEIFHLGNCIEQAKLYDDNTIQLILCDPPYALGEEGDGFHAPYNKRKKGVIRGYVPAPEDYDKFSLDWMTEAKRILKPTGSLYIVISHKRLVHILNAAEKLNLTLINHIIWSYNFVLHTTRHFSVAHTHILFYSKSDNPKFNTYCRFGPQELLENDYSLLAADLRDVWDISRNNRPKRIKNPTHLPAELVRKIILYSSEPGDYVMDMFAGEFTTAREAIKLGRRAVAMEANQHAWSAAFHIEKFKQECLAMASGKERWEQGQWPNLNPEREGEPFSENEKKEIYEDYLIGRVNGEHPGEVLKHLYEEYERQPYSIGTALAEMAAQDKVETLHSIKPGQDLPGLKKVVVLQPGRQGKPWTPDEQEEIKMKHKWNLQEGLTARQSYKKLAEEYQRGRFAIRKLVKGY